MVKWGYVLIVIRKMYSRLRSGLKGAVDPVIFKRKIAVVGNCM
jgi:hypothetical protein